MGEIKELRAEVEGLRRIIARSDAKADMWQIRAEAAERERDEARAEVERLRRSLGDHERWRAQWEDLAEAAEARLRKVEALADEWGRFEHIGSHLWGVHAADLRAALAADLRAALAAEPAERHFLTGPIWTGEVVAAELGVQLPAEVTPPAEQRAEGGA